MLEVKAFKGYRYNTTVVGSCDDVITPPFDVISPRQRESLAARSPYNIVHVILPQAEPPEQRYERAADRFNAWIDEGALVQDDEESYYLLEQRFFDSSGGEHVRKALFAAVKIPEPGEQTVLGHERTFRHKIEDRLELTRATRSNMGGIFVMYFDREHALRRFLRQTETRAADLRAETIDGVMVKLWRVPADPVVAEFFANQTLYIADGHHRFATAVAYRDEMRAKEKPDGLRPYDYVFMGLVNFDDPGLLVYPAHRVLDPPEHFSMESFLNAMSEWFSYRTTQPESLERLVNESEGCALGLATHTGPAYLFTLKDGVDRKAFLQTSHGEAWQNLDVAVLHAGILERCMGLAPDAELLYEPDTDAALRTVRDGDRQMAFILKGATPDQIKACADAGEFMPQKATYLFPKLPTGAVFHRLV